MSRTPARVIHEAAGQGPRPAMEDRHAVAERWISGRRVVFCGVYDGHGGAAVATLAASELHHRFFEALEAGGETGVALGTAYAAVASAAAEHDHTGSTACTAVLIDARLTVAWLGDSRLAVVSPGGVQLFTPAHGVDDPEERARILAHGGAIAAPYLVRGEHGVMVTRAFGDAWYRPVGLFDRPSLSHVDLDPRTRYLAVLATDGLWEVVTPVVIAELLADWIRQDCPPGVDHARTLVDLAFRKGASDNVTVITIALPAPGEARPPAGSG